MRANADLSRRIWNSVRLSRYEGLYPMKYAVSPSERGGTIRVEGRTRGSMLELAVSDDGPGLNGNPVPSGGRGVGLRNTRERLAALYDDRHRFATIDNKPGLRIELGLPLQVTPA